MPEWTNSCHPHEPKRHTQTDHFNLTKHTHGAGSPGEQSGAHRAAFRVTPLECNGYAPSATSIATSRHHPYGTYVQSASTAWQGDAGRGISGLTCQHHWTRRMNVRSDTPNIAAACASLIRSVAQTRNAWNSTTPRALPARQCMHRHRCLPEDVVLFLCIGSPHIVHSLTLDDFPLPIRQAQQGHVFRKSQAGLPIMPQMAYHPATRLAAVRISRRIKHTFCHLTRIITDCRNRRYHQLIRYPKNRQI